MNGRPEVGSPIDDRPGEEEIALNEDRRVRDALGSPPSSILKFGPTLILGLLVLLLVVAYLVEYPDVIYTEAVVTTELPPQREFARATGKVEALLVQDGQEVFTDTPLAIIENTANHQDVLLLKSVMDTVAPKNGSFSFPIDNLPILFLGDIEIDFALFENNYLQYMLNRELRPFSNEAAAKELALWESKTRLRSMQSQRNTNLMELDFKKKKVERHKVLLDKGVLSPQEFENEQIAYLKAERDQKDLEIAISQLRQNIKDVERNVKEIQIDKTREEIKLLRSVIQSFDQLKGAIRDWERKYVLRSNIEGRVSFVNVWSEHQNVNRGDLIFTVTPSERSSFIARLKTPVLNSGKIMQGQRVNIKLLNYPYAEMGMLLGRVHNISAVTDMEGFYMVDVALSDRLITTYGKEIPFKQEMIGTAEIVTEDRSLIHRFFYSLRKAL